MGITDTLKDSFGVYAGMTIQKRALVDVRDCIKPSARMSIYSQYIDKLLPTKPFEKSSVSVASAMKHFYPFGDAGLYSMLARLGKPFAMRYPLEEFQGSTGDLTESDNQAAMRYTNMRLAPLSMRLFQNIEKESIEKWYDSYTGKEKYPSVLPSLGYYNICNGSTGIATAVSSSIPSFNLREINDAMIRLLWNPELSAEEVVCMPDFCDGGELLNGDEVRASIIAGEGKSCILRAKVDYDGAEHSLIFTQTPYGVYTGTIYGQIADIVNSENNPGIERFWDQSGNNGRIKVKLSKNAKPKKVISYLFKNTNLQYHYPIHMMMLDHGKTPRIFGLKDALLSHLEHERITYTNSFKYDLSKINARLHIIEGLLKAISCIDEVIATIRESASTKDASLALQALLSIDEEQAKTILDIKLNRLARLEVAKLQEEQASLLTDKARIEAILSDASLLNKEIEKGLKEVAEKFGDDRRTTILNVTEKEETEEEKELPPEKNVSVLLLNDSSISVYETEEVKGSSRGRKGTAIKLPRKTSVVNAVQTTNYNDLYFISNTGKLYWLDLADVAIGSNVSLYEAIKMSSDEEIICMMDGDDLSVDNYIVFVTKNGMVKKSLLSNYNIKKKGGTQALKLKEGDSVISCFISTSNEDKLLVVSSVNNYAMYPLLDISLVGRVAMGVKAMNLKDGETICGATLVRNSLEYKGVLVINNEGRGKITPMGDFKTTSRAVKGNRIQKQEEGKYVAAVAAIEEESKTLTVVVDSKVVKVNVDAIPVQSANTIGVSIIDAKKTSGLISIMQG